MGWIPKAERRCERYCGPLFQRGCSDETETDDEGDPQKLARWFRIGRHDAQRKGCIAGGDDHVIPGA